MMAHYARYVRPFGPQLAALPPSAAFVACIYLINAGSAAQDMFASLGVAGVAVATTVLLAKSVALPPGSHRLGWRLVTLGIAAWALAELLWLAYTLAGVDPFPSPADVFYLAGYPLLTAGAVIIGAPARTLARVRVALEGTAVACAIAASLWFVVLWPSMASAESWVEAIVGTAYPFLDVVLVVAVMTAVGAGRQGAPLGAVLPLALGLGSFVAADLAFALAELGNGYTPGVIDAGWFAGYLFIASSALTWRRAESHRPSEEYAAESVWIQYAVLTVPVIVSVLFVGDHLHHSDTVADYVFAGLTVSAISAAALRHAVAHRDQFASNRALRRIGEDLKAASLEAERASHAKSEFLSRMSHELRTPMNAVLGFGQLLQLDDLTDEQRENVDYIMSSGRHLLRLIDEVLDISRIEAGRLDLSIEPFDPAPLLAEVAEMVRPLAASTGIQLQVEPCPAGVQAVGDLQRTKQAVLNLVSNAIKYNRPGGTVRVQVQAAAGERLQISVADTGPGIPTDKLDSLFSPFDRLGAEKTGIEGTGLGLALSRVLVEAMSGALTVESEVGVGSTFAIVLPALVDHQDGPLSAEGGGRTVVYVERGLAGFGVIERALRQLGDARILAAPSAAEGIALCGRSAVSVILLDQNLPDMPVADAVRALKSDLATRHVPIVVIGPAAGGRLAGHLLDDGVSAVLPKPLDIGDLLGTIAWVAGPGRAAA